METNRGWTDGTGHAYQNPLCAANIWVGIPLAIALALAGCALPIDTDVRETGASSPTDVPSSPTPSSDPSSTPTIASIPDTPTYRPAPTATPLPLPETCLRAGFSGDIAVCRSAPQYDIELDVDPDSARVTGHQDLRYVNAERESLTDLYLRLYPNSPNYGGSMTISRTVLAGEVISPFLEMEGTAMRIRLDPPLDPGGAVELSIDFSVEVPTNLSVGHGLFSYARGVMALPDVYPLVPAYDETGWNLDMAPEYADDVYAEISSYAVEVKAPADMTLVASGSCDQNGEGTWSCDAAPMREFTLILSRNYRLVNRSVRGSVLNSYFYEGHDGGGRRALEVAANAVAVFSDLFGPYPYAELDVVETPNYLGGMEYPGLVVIEDGLYPRIQGLEWLVAHEVAHQWWFAIVGSDQVDDPWLDEALTQYSTMLYYEQVYGRERANDILQVEFIRTHRDLIRSGLDRPVGLPASDYNRSTYWTVVYDKGALYFHELRERVGDDDFFEILQRYYEQNQYQIATPESWLAAVEEVTGDRQMDVYENWIEG